MIELEGKYLIAVALSTQEAGSRIDGLEGQLEDAFTTEEHYLIDDHFPLDDNDIDWRTFEYGLRSLEADKVIVPYRDEEGEIVGYEVTERVHNMAQRVREDRVLSPEDYDFFEGLGSEIAA